MEGTVTESMLLPTDVAISLRKMAYEWEDAPISSEHTRSLEFLVGMGLQIASGVQLAWSLATEDDKVWESGGYLRRMQAIDSLATVVVDILTSTQKTLASTRAKHPDWVAPQGATAVDVRLQTVKQLAATIRETLNSLNRPRPPVNEE